MPTTTDIHPTLRQALVNLLSPHITTAQERQANLHLALPNAAYRKIDFHGAADVFTANMVDTLLQYGEIAPGKQALMAVLEVIHAQVGLNHQRAIEKLQQQLQDHFQTAGTVACPRCNKFNRTTARFCHACGTTLPLSAGTSTQQAPLAWPVRSFRLTSGVVLMVFVIGLVWGVAVFRREITTRVGGAVSSATVAATVRPTPPQPTATVASVPTDLPTPTAIALPLPTIASIPTTVFTAVAIPVPTATQHIACTLSAASAFGTIWNQATIGCALDAAQVGWASWTPFEHGYMMWRRDTDMIYIFYDNGQWHPTPDDWDGVSEPPSRGTPPAGRTAPKRGTGWVWAHDNAVFQGLGWATNEQKGFCAEVQTFEQGFLLQSSTVEFCHEEKLYNFAREATFGVLTLQVYDTRYGQR